MLKDTWTPKRNDTDDILAEDINGIANAVINLEENGGGGSGEPGKSPYIGDNGNWFEYKATEYVDTGVKAEGKNGFPKVVVYGQAGQDTQTELSFPAFTEMRFNGTVSYLMITDFQFNEESPNVDMWTITFTAGDYNGTGGPSISIPANVEWAVTDPVFTTGYTYYLSFVPFGEKILGVWVAKELS